MAVACPVNVARVICVVCCLACCGTPSGNFASGPETELPDQSKGERVTLLDATYWVGGDGQLEVEQNFSLEITGESMETGPELRFLTAFPGPGGLLLDTGFTILESDRDGQPEPYDLIEGEGYRTLRMGAADRTLEPGQHEYRLRYRTLGNWNYREGMAYGVFEITRPFEGLPMDRVTARVLLPGDLNAGQYAGALDGSSAAGVGFLVSQESSRTNVETTAPLRANHSLLLTMAWPCGKFAPQSRWLAVMQQHPRIPLAGISGLLLIGCLVALIRGYRRRRAMREPKTAATSAR